jgi:ATP-dependent Lon protease
VKNGLELIPVSNVMDVLKVALTGTPEPIEWDEVAEAAKLAAAREAGAASTGASAH